MEIPEGPSTAAKAQSSVRRVPGATPVRVEGEVEGFSDHRTQVLEQGEGV